MTLSNYIQEDIKSRLKRHVKHGVALPYDLTLVGLATYYDVSLTPVRVAVRTLVRQHYLRKEPNARLVVNDTALPDDGLDDDSAQLTRPPDWKEIIQRDVMLSSLRGDSGYLREEATAARYGVSRTVVRQAFGRLVGKGFLEHVPRAGWRVRRYEEADMRAYLVVREVIELKALELARPRLVHTDLEEMVAGNPIPAVGSPVRLDNRIHAYLIDKADNLYLRDFANRHGAYYMMLFEQAALEAQIVAEMAEQHRAILTALLAQDWPQSRRALADHIRAQQPVIRKLLTSLGMAEPSVANG